MEQANSEVAATTNKLRCVKTERKVYFMQRVDGSGNLANEKCRLIICV